MTRIFMDLSYGISGDMFISALGDAGVDFSRLQGIFHQAGMEVELTSVPERRNGIKGRSLSVSWRKEQPMRTLEQVTALIDRMELSSEVRNKAVKAFQRLASAEAKVHGMSPDQIHFHEVGALDTLVDIAGAFWGLEILGVQEVTASPMPWFRGQVNIAHGLVPLPAPATVELMQGKKIYASDFDWEIITPTGALIVDQVVSGFSAGFNGTLTGSGVGFGSMKKGFNGLRIFLWEEDGDHCHDQDQVWVLESNIDHLTGEELGLFFQKIMEAGALDVIFLQGIMKKNRPGGQLQVLCTDENLNRVRHEFFRQTLTLGLRISRRFRSLLPRKESSMSVNRDIVRAKTAEFSGREYHRPEMDDLAEKAAGQGLSPVEMRLRSNKT